MKGLWGIFARKSILKIRIFSCGYLCPGTQVPCQLVQADIKMNYVFKYVSPFDLEQTNKTFKH